MIVLSVEIIRVDNKGLLKEFILFPWKIYRNDRAWVPPLISEVHNLLDGKKNPFWEHSERELFLARRGGRTVGRIAGIIDRNYLAKFADGVGNFGFFECVDDLEVAGALTDAAAQWLKERGMAAMRGPMSPSANEECAILINGFDTPPFLLMTHNPAYYVGLMEGCGMKKAVDWVAYINRAPFDLPRTAIDAAEFARKKLPGLKVRPIDLRRFDEEKVRLREIYNSAWEENWGFVPMTDAEVELIMERLRPIVIPEITLLAEVEGKPAGMLVLLPNMNEALRHLNGRLFPFGIFKLLYYSRKIRSVRLFVMGVKKEYRMCGVEALLYVEAMKAGTALGFTECESSMVLEGNFMTRRAAETFGGTVYKTYRIYEKPV